MGRKARRCLVHAGLAKTGTTAIQAFCAANRALLLEREGILYPGTEICHNQLQALFSADPSRLIQVRRLGIADGEAAAERLAAGRAEFEREVAAAEPERILVSSEYFVSMTPRELAALREHLLGLAEEVEVLAYVRDPWSFAESYLQQCLRDGLWSGPIEIGYMKSNLELLGRLEEGFGRPPTVRAYLQDEAASFDVVRDFLAAIGVDPERGPWLGAGRRPNEAVSFETACLLTAFNAWHPQYDAEGAFVPSAGRDWILRALSEAGRGGGRIRISAAAARRIHEAAREDLDILHERYFGGDDVYDRHYRNRGFAGEHDLVALDRLGREEIAALLFEALEGLSRRAGDYLEWARRAEAGRLHYHALDELREGRRENARASLRQALRYRSDYPEAAEALAALEAEEAGASDGKPVT